MNNVDNFITKITNQEVYNSRMAKAIEDKLWFAKFLKMPIFQNSVVYDYGCADGELIRHLAPLFPHIQFVGIDNSDDMINLARQRQIYPNETYVHTRQVSRVNRDKDKLSIVIMSSIWHEIVNYCDNHVHEIKERFQWIRPDYIFFRDMIPNDSINRNALQSDIDKVDNKEWFNEVRNKVYDLQTLEFKIRQGEFKNQRNLVHFLMKYRYVENWDREVKENYFPCTYNELIDIFSPIFNPIYSKSYTLPYLKETIKQDFDIDLVDHTHVNIVFKCKTQDINWFKNETWKI